MGSAPSPHLRPLRYRLSLGRSSLACNRSYYLCEVLSLPQISFFRTGGMTTGRNKSSLPEPDHSREGRAPALLGPTANYQDGVGGGPWQSTGPPARRALAPIPGAPRSEAGDKPRPGRPEQRPLPTPLRPGRREAGTRLPGQTRRWGAGGGWRAAAPVLTPAATGPAQELLLLRVPDEFLPAALLLGFSAGHGGGSAAAAGAEGG